MGEQRKAYYAIIPATVRYDKNIPTGAKLLYGEITALCNQEGFCWATNSYFSELYETSERTVQRWISALEDGCYILKNIEYGDDGKTVIRRCLSIANVTTPHDKNVTTPHDKNVTYNNTYTNNTNNHDVNGRHLKELLRLYPSIQIDVNSNAFVDEPNYAVIIEMFEKSEYLRTNCNSLSWLIKNHAKVESGQYTDKPKSLPNNNGCPDIEWVQDETGAWRPKK